MHGQDVVQLHRLFGSAKDSELLVSMLKDTRQNDRLVEKITHCVVL